MIDRVKKVHQLDDFSMDSDSDDENLFDLEQIMTEKQIEEILIRKADDIYNRCIQRRTKARYILIFINEIYCVYILLISFLLLHT